MEVQDSRLPRYGRPERGFLFVPRGEKHVGRPQRDCRGNPLMLHLSGWRPNLAWYMERSPSRGPEASSSAVGLIQEPDNQFMPEVAAFGLVAMERPFRRPKRAWSRHGDPRHRALPSGRPIVSPAGRNALAALAGILVMQPDIVVLTSLVALTPGHAVGSSRLNTWRSR